MLIFVARKREDLLDETWDAVCSSSNYEDAAQQITDNVVIYAGAPYATSDTEPYQVEVRVQPKGRPESERYTMWLWARRFGPGNGS